MPDVVLLFPGQGSQKPGMARDLVNADLAAREVFATVDATLGEPLSRLCFDGPADMLTLTHNAQPALLAHGMAVWQMTRSWLAPRVRAAAGHSLGEFTAHAAAGTLTLAAAARLVRLRGELMHSAGEERPGTMAAILGELSEPIAAICERASMDGEGGLVVPANFNAPGQVVISGEVSGVEKAMDMCRAAGAKRAVRLNVSGAFHSPLMAPARAGLLGALTSTALGAPVFPVYANVSTDPVRLPAVARELLVEQLTAPVRWTELVRRLAVDFPSALYVEMGPGSVLTGLVRKIAPNARAVSCGTLTEIRQLHAALS
ncbi:MAG: ACP S-malonyltransferase [Gemmatimonadaceae bacterium]